MTLTLRALSPLSATVAFTLFAFASTAHAAAAAPRTITVPSNVFPTIQAGVNAVAEGGTVRIQPGLYVEHVVVAGKSVKLAGVLGGQGRATISAPDNGSAVITFGLSGHGTVQDVTLVGGSAGIEAPPTPNQGPGASVIVRQVEARAGTHGIAGQFDSLDVANSKFERVSRHGVVAIQPRVFKLQRTLFRTGGSVGIYIVNNGPPTGDVAWVVTRTTVIGFAEGGLHVVGRGAPVLVSWFDALDNGVAGITLDGTPAARVTSSVVAGSYPDGAGQWGDGIRIAGAAVDLVDVTVDSVNRAGVSIFGCAETGQVAKAYLKDVKMHEPGFDIDMEVYPGCGSSVADSVLLDEYVVGLVSSNLCVHAATPDDVTCTAQSSGPAVPVGAPAYP